MKLSIFAMFLMLICTAAQAGTITRGVEEQKKLQVPLLNVISPTDVAKTQTGANRSVQLILDTYSDEELRNYAVRVNNADRKAARLSGQLIPAKLNENTLNNREKIGEYLRSRYKFKY